MQHQKTILIIGGSGFLGSRLIMHLKDAYKIFATYCSKPFYIPGVTCLALNLEHKKTVKALLYQIHPDVVVYVAGAKGENFSFQDCKVSEKIHLMGLSAVLASFDVMQPRFIFISNSLVFDGAKGNYHENDIVLPKNEFGKIKLSAENTIRNKCLNYIILRLSLVFGVSAGSNLSFLDQLRMRLDRQQNVDLIDDEFHSFVWIKSVCEVIDTLIQSHIRNKVFHYGGLTKVTPFGFGMAFAKWFHYSPELLVPKKALSQVLPDSNTRMHFKGKEVFWDYSLNSTQIAETLKVKAFLLEESFDLFEKDLITIA